MIYSCQKGGSIVMNVTGAGYWIIEWQLGILIGFIAGIFANFVYLVVRRMFRKYNQCKVEIGDIGILGDDKLRQLSLDNTEIL